MKFPANRVTQLDSYLLDSTLVEHFRTEVDKILEPFSRGSNESVCIVIREIITLLYNLSQSCKGKTPGHMLLNIGNLSSTRKQLLWNYVIGTVTRRTLEVVTLVTQHRYILKLATKLLAFLSLIEFIHHFYFLNRGGPSKVLERILNLKTMYTTRPTLGTLNFDGLNREMIGHSFGHFCVLFTLLLQYIKYISNSRKSRLSANLAKHASGSPFLCEKCEKFAIFPTTSLDSTHEDNFKILCYYCRMIDGNSKILFCGKT